jgi:hypothetical protein
VTDPVPLGRRHQTCVDAYAAPHVGPKAPLITVFVALNQLYLVLEHELFGQQGREANSYLATHFWRNTGLF